MSVILPKELKEVGLIPGLALACPQGKVRDTYILPGHPELMLVVASDRISIYDVVLNALIKGKGENLTAATVFWKVLLEQAGIMTDLVTYGAGIDTHLPPELRGNLELQRRAVVVKRLTMLPIEAIVRSRLTGTALSAYKQNDGVVCGIQLPSGLKNGDALPRALFTPTTKAKSGPDQHLLAEQVSRRYPGLELSAIVVFGILSDYAKKRGIELVDTKFEFGYLAGREQLVLGDEVGTPDSSRYCDVQALLAALLTEQRDLPSMDKERVRTWGKTHQLHDKAIFDSANPEHVAWAQTLEVPPSVINEAQLLYRRIFYRLTGQKIETYQREVMGVPTPPLSVHVDVVVGSESDLPQLRAGLRQLWNWKTVTGNEVRLHVCSTHRNPIELIHYAQEVDPKNRVIIACAGLAAALPGQLDAHLAAFKKEVPVIGVAMAGKTSGDNLAARVSISKLPGQPVHLNKDGEAYFGSDGFVAACRVALETEFEPVLRANKPAKFNLDINELLKSG